MKYKITGHEKFPMRYPWLPKAVMAVQANSRIFSDENEAIVEMGVGKNMVRSIRFWAVAAGIIKMNGNGGYVITEFGDALFGERGLDPFIEDIQTLWLLHWKLANANDPPLLAWDYLLNRWHEPEIARSVVLNSLEKEAENMDIKLSSTTLRDHLDVFIRTYAPTRGPKGEAKEDNLDSPLVELELIRKTGERNAGPDSGKREPIYAFRREEKHEISSELFVYCLFDFLYRRHQNESTISFREISVGHGSPGQVFKLPENDLRERLETLEDRTDGSLTYMESASIQQIRKNSDAKLIGLLQSIYSRRYP